jgi:O-antigen/teichoic acid export membrane protein
MSERSNPNKEATLLLTLLGGIVPLGIAIAFLGILLAKVPSIPLWIIVAVGIVLMIWSLLEAVRSGEEQFGATAETKLPEGQQQRGGVS